MKPIDFAIALSVAFTVLGLSLPHVIRAAHPERGTREAASPGSKDAR